MTAKKSLMEVDYEQRIDLSLWKKLWAYTLPYRKNVWILCGCAFLTAACDVTFPLITRELVDDIIENGAAVDYVPYAWVYAVTTVLICLSIFGFIYQGGLIRTHIGHDIRDDGFRNLQRLSFSFYDKYPVGWLMARMTSDCDRLTQILAWGVLDLVWGLTLMAGCTVIMFSLSPTLTLMVLSIGLPMALLSLVFQKKILRASRKVRKTNSRLTASYNEGIMGIRTSKIFSRHDQNLTEFQEQSGTMYRASVRNQLLNALYLPAVMVLGSIGIAMALSRGGYEVSLGFGLASLGTLLAYLTYVRHFFEPVQELAAWLAEMQMAQASAERILGLIEAEPEISDSSEVWRRIEENVHKPRPLGVAEDGHSEHISKIEFASVDFSYGAEKTVLEGFDLTVHAGETIALVGPTGGGKSTIVSLLCRFYEPARGEIRFDGVDYRLRGLHWLQSKLGIVLQTPHLFSGTIAANILYSKLDATAEEVEAVARTVGAHDFIAEMEDGYDSEVGEGGLRLSTGQKQLISFARAILAEPEILVMDEATSSVDTETERYIQRGLARVLEGRTSFVIAHRLSTVRNADRILVIRDHGIAEQGSHAELMAARGHYHDLYLQQKLREAVVEEEPEDRGGLGVVAPVT